MTQTTWQEQGSAAKPYDIVLADDGRMSCSCPRWLFPRNHADRLCKHIHRIASANGLRLETRGKEVFVVGAAAPTTTAPTTPRAKSAQATPTTSPAQPPAPMLASAMPEGWNADRYDPREWVLEEKWDGHRLIVRVKSGTVRAWARPRAGAKEGIARDLPEHIVSTAALLADGVYDCELIVPGGKSFDVTRLTNTRKLVLMIFDLLEAVGHDVTRRPQRERRAMLEVATAEAVKNGAVRVTEQQPPSQAAVQAIWDRGGEGAIIKRLDALYRPGVRSPDWVKAKGLRHVVVTVTGFEEGKSGPYSTTVGVDAKGTPVPVKTLDNATLRQIERDPTSFVGRRLVVQYQEQTPDGKYRHPMWDHWAADHER